MKTNYEVASEQLNAVSDMAWEERAVRYPALPTMPVTWTEPGTPPIVTNWQNDDLGYRRGVLAAVNGRVSVFTEAGKELAPTQTGPLRKTWASGHPLEAGAIKAGYHFEQPR